MTPIFIDTSFLIALTLSDDALHGRALAWQEAVSGPYVTTEYVLLEFVDAMAFEPLRSTAISTVRLLQGDPAVEIVPASRDLFQRGLSLFEGRPDKRWSLTDCISFTVMTHQKMTDALTHDHHFDQAGFRALLRIAPPPRP
jgi:predicted nucleic acid-binding protein